MACDITDVKLKYRMMRNNLFLLKMSNIDIEKLEKC